MTDNNFWKKAYKDLWEKASTKEETLRIIIQKTTGLDGDRVEITCTTNQLDIVNKGEKFYGEWNPYGKFYGEWRLEDGDDTYIVDVQ